VLVGKRVAVADATEPRVGVAATYPGLSVATAVTVALEVEVRGMPA